MSAAVLLRAATLIRERAQAATAGPWEAFRQYDANHRAEFYGVSSETIGFPNVFHDRDAEVADVEHIASWHPVVALAVADWLEETALRWDWVEERELALTVARAYLGESA